MMMKKKKRIEIVKVTIMTMVKIMVVVNEFVAITTHVLKAIFICLYNHYKYYYYGKHLQFVCYALSVYLHDDISLH